MAQIKLRQTTKGSENFVSLSEIFNRILCSSHKKGGALLEYSSTWIGAAHHDDDVIAGIWSDVDEYRVLRAFIRL